MNERNPRNDESYVVAAPHGAMGIDLETCKQTTTNEQMMCNEDKYKQESRELATNKKWGEVVALI